MCMQETGYSSSCCDEKLLVLLVSQFKTVKFLLCENSCRIFQYYGDETLSFSRWSAHMAKISKIECYLLLFTILYFNLPKRVAYVQFYPFFQP